MSDDLKKQNLIRDIPSFVELAQQAQLLRAAKKALPYLGPLMKIFKVDVSKIHESLMNAEELAYNIEELRNLPDRFNGIFSERGWIIYDIMNLEVAKMAVVKAESGDIDGAEEDLVAYYTPETVRWKLRMMHGVDAFLPRMRLAEKALDDYEAERYHASVPVVLALMDGLVNDLHECRKGFFAQGVELEAWDSLAAHDKGLGVLTRIFQKGRRATTVEKIRVPYRNGILHGMDLGYDTKMVAAKTWAALFAVRDWAIKAAKEELKPPPEPPARTWVESVKDLAKDLAKKAEVDKALDQWEPRPIDIDADMPAAGDPEQYSDGTPERLLVEYLSYWQKKNFGYMAKCLSEKYALSGSDAILRVRNEYKEKNLLGFGILGVDDQAPAITEITTLLRYVEDGNETEKQFTFRLIYMNEEGLALPRSMAEGRWQLITWAIY